MAGRWRQVDGMDSFFMIGIVIVVLMVGLGTGFSAAAENDGGAVPSGRAEGQGGGRRGEARRGGGAEGSGDPGEGPLFPARDRNLSTEAKERRQELLNMEKRLLQKEENLEKRVDILDQKEGGLTKREKDAPAAGKDPRRKRKEICRDD